MTFLKGTTIILIDKVETDKDPFGKPRYEDREIVVKNVLIAPVSSDDIVNALELTGKKAVYTLAIPKDDKNEWEDREVIFFEKRWRTFGFSTEGLSNLIPLDWNKKVMVERYE